MSTTGAVGGASSAWSGMANARASAMKDRMFAKVDSDGSGSVDKTELQSMLDTMAKKTGASAGDAGELLGKMDADGSGSLNANELAAGMKSLRPTPASTLAFAQQRSGEAGSAGPAASSALFNKLDNDGSGGLDGGELNALLDKIAAGTGASSRAGVSDSANADVFKSLDTDADGSISPAELGAVVSGPGGPGGHAAQGARPAHGPGGGGAGASGASSSSTSYEALDTNEDGTVSAQERAAGAAKDLVNSLLSALNGNGPQGNDKASAGSFKSTLASAFRSALDATGGAASSSSSSGGGSGGAASGGSNSDEASAATTSRAGHRSHRLDMSALNQLVQKAYSQAATQAAQTASSVSLAA